MVIGQVKRYQSLLLKVKCLCCTYNKHSLQKLPSSSVWPRLWWVIKVLTTVETVPIHFVQDQMISNVASLFLYVITSFLLYLVPLEGYNLSHVMRKPVMPYANNKGADQPAHLRSLISAFVVRCLDSIILPVSISRISSVCLASVAGQARLSLTWSKTSKTGFLVTRLIYRVCLWPFLCTA